MVNWTFFDYVSPANSNPIVKWLDTLTTQERSDLRELLKYLSKVQNWQHPVFKWLRGKKYQGLGEIRFKTLQGIPLRLIGIKGNEPNTFIFLVGCSHKENYDPPSALDTANKRRGDLNKEATICDHREN